MKLIAIFLIIFGFATLSTIAMEFSSNESEFVKAMDRTTYLEDSAEELAEYNQPEEAVEESHSRAKRYTCDVLRSTAACVFHCKLLGKSGGYCSRKLICTCRR